MSAAGKLLGNNEACFCNEECEMYRQHFAVWTLRTGGHCGTGKHKSKVISGCRSRVLQITRCTADVEVVFDIAMLEMESTVLRGGCFYGLITEESCYDISTYDLC